MKAKIITFTILSLFILGPALPAEAQNVPPLVPCGHVVDGQLDECGFEDFIELINNIISFLLFISVPIAVIAFIYSGFLFMTSQGDAAQVSKARGIFKNVAIGFIFVLSAWLIVYLIVTSLLDPESYELFF